MVEDGLTVMMKDTCNSWQMTWKCCNRHRTRTSLKTSITKGSKDPEMFEEGASVMQGNIGGSLAVIWESLDLN